MMRQKATTPANALADALIQNMTAYLTHTDISPERRKKAEALLIMAEHIKHKTPAATQEDYHQLLKSCDQIQKQHKWGHLHFLHKGDRFGDALKQSLQSIPAEDHKKASHSKPFLEKELPQMAKSNTTKKIATIEKAKTSDRDKLLDWYWDNKPGKDATAFPRLDTISDSHQLKNLKADLKSKVTDMASTIHKLEKDYGFSNSDATSLAKAAAFYNKSADEQQRPGFTNHPNRTTKKAAEHVTAPTPPPTTIGRPTSR